MPAGVIGVGGVRIDPSDTTGVPFVGKGGAVANDIVAVASIDPFRDRFWPRSVISFLVLATVMTLLSVQFVTPTRRWRPSLPGPVRRRIRKSP
jgi:hypothetical protein